MRLRLEHVVALTAAALLLAALGSRIAARPFNMPALHTVSVVCFFGGIAVTFVPLIGFLACVMWEKLTESEEETDQ